MAIQIKKALSPAAPSALIKQNKYAKHLMSPAPTHKAEQVVGTMTTQKTASGVVVSEGAEQELVHPGMIVQPSNACKVKVGGSRTINTGNYESVKINVEIEMVTVKEAIEETYEFCTEWVSEKLAKAVKGV